MKKSCKNPLTVIDGGKEDLERKKSVLFSRPEVLEQQEFERLCDVLGLQLADVESLIARRVCLRAKDALERDALLAILNGNLEEAQKLVAVMQRRNDLGLSVISTS